MTYFFFFSFSLVSSLAFFGGRYTPITTAWSRSYGSSVSCSLGLKSASCSFFTSRANTAVGSLVLSMQLALMLMIKWPPFCKKYAALMATMRAWSGCASQARSSVRYLPLSAKFYLASLVTRAFIQTSSTNERGSHENKQNARNRTPDCGGTGA